MLRERERESTWARVSPTYVFKHRALDPTPFHEISLFPSLPASSDSLEKKKEDLLRFVSFYFTLARIFIYLIISIPLSHSFDKITTALII